MSSSSSSTTNWSPTRKSYQRNQSWNNAKYNTNNGNNDSDNIAKREFQEIIEMLSEG
jgi:hypothetical protein